MYRKQLLSLSQPKSGRGALFGPHISELAAYGLAALFSPAGKNEKPALSKSIRMTQKVNRELLGSEWLFFLLGYQEPRFYLPDKEQILD